MITAFLVGFFGLLHCYGMCGGIVGALSMSLAPSVRAHRLRLVWFTLLYNLGRIISYTIAGLISGFTGQVLGYMLHQVLLGNILRIFAAVMIVAIGAYVAEWLPRLAYLEHIGDPLWRRLWPLARGLLPIHTPLQAWLSGFLWGWLPCGLVYSMLMVAAISGSPVDGAAQMLAFGIGTLPNLWFGSIMLGWLMHLHGIPWLRLAAGLVLIASSLIVM